LYTISAGKPEMEKGVIFDIKRYAIHDGPGIRTTVFLKGCSLRCPWCHNPEGVEEGREVMFRPERCATDCRACLSLCPQNALKKNGSAIVLDRTECDLCGICTEACAFEVFEVVGREMTAEQLVREIEKDRVFFEESGGGVTLSGGEPLVQTDFLEVLLERLNSQKIHTVLDTSGCVSRKNMERISDRVDLFLYDLKIMDEEKHRELTGESNLSILENLCVLAERGKNIVIRVPLIMGITDDDQNILRMAELLERMKTVKKINFLPYHKGGSEKHRRLGKEGSYPEYLPPTGERIERLEKICSDRGFFVKTGG
jgi:pyruvate formate lyase activating enzyme